MKALFEYTELVEKLSEHSKLDINDMELLCGEYFFTPEGTEVNRLEIPVSIDDFYLHDDIETEDVKRLITMVNIYARENNISEIYVTQSIDELISM